MPNSQSIHDQWVAAIARDQFSFPLQPTWRTSTNPGSFKRQAVRFGSVEAFPDIVVADSTNRLVIVAEVETSESVNEIEARQWRQYSAAQLFYLYVPQGWGAQAMSVS